ncbi:hypothetical protein FOC84_18545 [Achromobacter pestifer]|uniref:Uncharacterized protein n=1 Tax=Achromobacter pestifer TaxID=1353889 RepID=A0A7D4E7K2_9BURK|nr:hypothetical protein [Achromobacter pestifer]QKH36831.1 hypothetical protein FOC84_18545 [Achromobacter pestifer]
MAQPSARVLEGTFDQLRLAVPLVRRDAFLRIGAESVIAAGLEAPQINQLHRLHQQGISARVGVMDGEEGLAVFSWAVPARGEPIPPRCYQTLKRRGWREVAVGGAVGAAFVWLAWLLGIGSLTRVFLMVFSLVAALVALVVAGSALHGLWHNRRHRPLILASEALYDPKQRPAAGTPAPPPQPPRQEPLSAQDEGEPPIGHVRGHLAGLTHEMRQVHKGPNYGIYRYAVNGVDYAMIAQEAFGDALPFLAEDDRVELAVRAAPVHPDGRRAVYALRNLEDGRCYMCHRYYGGEQGRDTPIRVGMSQRARMLKLIGGLLLTAWLFVVGLQFFAEPGDGSFQDLPELAVFLLALFFIVWLGFALPLLWLDTRWRMGRPTRRQRFTQRIYAMLDLGTPLAPSQRIEDL